MKMIIRRDKRTFRQKLFSRDSLRRVHTTIAVLLLVWVYWQAIGRSAGYIAITQWEMDNIWPATGIHALKMIFATSLAATSRDVRQWWYRLTNTSSEE